MRSVTDNTLLQNIMSTSTVNKILCVSVLGVVILGLRIFFGRSMSCIHDCRGVTKTIKELVCGLFEKSSKAEQKAVPPKIENIQEKKASEIKKEEKKKIPEIGEIKEPTAPKTKKEEPKVVPRIEQKVPATKEEEATEKNSILVSPAVVPEITNQTIPPEKEKTEIPQEETELAKIKEDKTSNTKEVEKKEVPTKIEEDKALEQAKAPQIKEAEVPKIEDEKTSEVKEEEKKRVPKIEELEQKKVEEKKKIPEIEEIKEPTASETKQEIEKTGPHEIEELEEEEVVSESNPSVMPPREPSAKYQESLEKIDLEMEQYTSRLNIESCHWENDALNGECKRFCVNSTEGFVSFMQNG